MATLAGHIAAFYTRTHDAAVLFTEEPFTDEGSQEWYYITDRSLGWWDKSQALTFEVQTGGKGAWVATTPAEIAYTGGYARFSPPLGATDLVRATGYGYTMFQVGGAYEWNITGSQGLKDTTRFRCVAKEYTPVMFTFEGDASLWWWVLQAGLEYGSANAKIGYRAVKYGPDGNAITVTVDATAADQALSVSVTGTDITIYPETVSGVVQTTVLNIIAAIALTPTAAALIEGYLPSGTGGSVIAAMTQTALSGGYSEDWVKYLGDDMLMVWYTDYDNNARWEGVGAISKIGPKSALDGVAQMGLNFAGSGKLYYHTT